MITEPNPGRYVMTHLVRDWVFVLPERMAWLAVILQRHEADDWGELDMHDITVNREARNLGSGRIMSVYNVPADLRRPVDGAWRSTLWVITDDIEDPAAFTTVLFPSEY